MKTYIKLILLFFSFQSAFGQSSPSNAAYEEYIDGVKALKKKKFAVAISCFNKALEHGNHTNDVFYNRGVAYLNLGDKDKACDSWMQAIKGGDFEAEKLFISICAKKPDQPDTSEYTGEPFTWVQEMPTFPGGDQQLLRYIQSHINYPAAAYKNSIQGRITVRFIVDVNGRVERANIPKGMGIGEGCDEEAIRVVSSLPDWNPGKQNGHPVPVWYTVPVIFKLN